MMLGLAVSQRAFSLSRASLLGRNASFTSRVRVTSFRQALPQSRSYAQQLSKPQSATDSLKRVARDAARNSKQTVLPEKMLIYHAGTFRTTFLALLKLTTLFIGAFTCGVIVPTYVRADEPVWDTARVALYGLIPPLFTAITTSGFVTYIHVHLPNQARASRAVLERLVRSPSGLPPSTRLTITTMSFLGRPRVTSVRAGDLVPVRQRLGLVNYRRSAASADEDDGRRKWYMFPGVRRFYVQKGRPGVRPRRRYEEKTDKVEWWIWEIIKEKLASRATRTAAVPTNGA